MVAEAARAFGVRAVACGADLDTVAGCDALIRAGVDALGGVDVVVINHGVWPAEAVAVEEMDDARWAATMRADLDSVFWLSRAAARAKRRPKSREIPVTSTTRPMGEGVLLAELAALDARLLEQLAVLLLGHALAPLLDDRTHGETFPFGRRSSAGPRTPYLSGVGRVESRQPAL